MAGGFEYIFPVAGKIFALSMTASRSPLFLATWAMARIVLPVCFQVRIHGIHYLPAKGPALLIPKHQQWWDVPLLGTYIPRPLNFLAKQELFINALSRFYMSRVGGISIDRLNPVKSLTTFRSLSPLIQRKSFLVLFPEGTYFPGTIGAGKWRLIQFILRLQQKNALPSIPFVPIGIHYSSQEKKGQRKVEIAIGPALTETNPCRAESFTRELLGQVKTLSRL
jgi:1-acyl-sn-glycerol-3-phosphate acyltransferase